MYTVRPFVISATCVYPRGVAIVGGLMKRAFAGLVATCSSPLRESGSARSARTDRVSIVGAACTARQVSDRHRNFNVLWASRAKATLCGEPPHICGNLRDLTTRCERHGHCDQLLAGVGSAEHLGDGDAIGIVPAHGVP